MNTKQAACLNCRKSKIKCRRDEGAPICERCQHVGIDCVIPDFHIGRQKGVKKYVGINLHSYKLTQASKRSGLEKAIHQVEEAIKKRRTDVTTSQSTLQHLQKLLSETQGCGRECKDEDAESSGSNDVVTTTKEVAGPSSDDQLALEGVENPLQLLARASDLRIASPHNSTTTPGSQINGSEQSAFLDVHRFFLPMKASFDQGSSLDPIDVGLVTMEEATMLLE